ncbi:hypothetical protein CK203_077664 [Vitis vinifera]|uniref:Uncharacterized protein n=1 Tax=Vitis vinifera TaxID=29760 RepID=A0A438BWY2_VITVI|nr:hypothetical protein CK203_077664 [Vitis vinifera]
MYLDESWRSPDKCQTSLFLPLSVVGGQRWLDLKSLVHAISVEESIARGLWTYTTPSPNIKGKKPVGSSSRLACNHDHHIREPLPLPPRPYAQRPARQFTPLGMTLTRAFEKLRDAGMIVPLAPRLLLHLIPPHFRLHEHCSDHQI